MSAVSTHPSDRRRWLTLPVILLATFMASFDYMVVNVAAPSLSHDLHAGPSALELVVGGYGFTYAAAMVTGGKLGDLYGHRRLFTLGMTGFALASLLCGLAQSPAQLVGARLLQGLTAAAMAPQVLALITALFPVQSRPRAMSWFGVAIGTGGIAGQVLGGLLLQADLLGLGWRVIFLVNVPVGTVAVAAALRLLPAGEPGRRSRLDPLGALGVCGSLALALAPLVLGRDRGWPLWCWVSLAAAVPALYATLRWERGLARRGGEPLLDPALFRSRSFSAGLTVNVALMASFGGLMFVQTLLLQSGLGLGARSAGLVFLPMGAASMAASLLGRGLVARFGTRVLYAGTGICALGMAVLAVSLHLTGGGLHASLLIAPLGLFGLGSGLAVPSLMGTVLSGVRPAQAGSAAGVLTTAQQFASATGVAALGAVFFASLGAHPGRNAYASAAELTTWIGVFLLVVATALIALLPRPSATTAPARPAPAKSPASA
ncbi:MFS transporter [Streptomyces sp. NBC_01465]|uniref:MFS transporter n=1 Tax=Streptomyces sp. NBC_01465 TaxID=2903878 RepID=UPI002E3219F7|nr:MFS transporter [Streptomyces sp. NBC_01465]